MFPKDSTSALIPSCTPIYPSELEIQSKLNPDFLKKIPPTISFWRYCPPTTFVFYWFFFQCVDKDEHLFLHAATPMTILCVKVAVLHLHNVYSPLYLHSFCSRFNWRIPKSIHTFFINSESIWSIILNRAKDSSNNFFLNTLNHQTFLWSNFLISDLLNLFVQVFYRILFLKTFVSS